MIRMISMIPVMIDVDDGDALFTDKDKDGDECEGPPKTHKRRKKRRVVILMSQVTIDVADGDVLFTDKDKDGDECERPPKTHKRRKKSNHARKPHDSTGNQKV